MYVEGAGAYSMVGEAKRRVPGEGNGECGRVQEGAGLYRRVLFMAGSDL